MIVRNQAATAEVANRHILPPAVPEHHPTEENGKPQPGGMHFRVNQRMHAQRTDGWRVSSRIEIVDKQVLIQEIGHRGQQKPDGEERLPRIPLPPGPALPGLVGQQ
jgi:hypothetical protein